MQSLFRSAVRLSAVAAMLAGSAAMQAATLGTTTVALNSSTVSALVSGGITPGAVAPGTLTGLNAAFPITAVSTTGTMITHSGGLSFTKGSTMAEIENFVINLNTDQLTGDVFLGASLVSSGVTFFDIGTGNALTLDPSLASAFNGVFGTNLAAGTPIGTATVSLATTATPEPTSAALMGVGGLLAAALLRRKRQTV